MQFYRVKLLRTAAEESGQQMDYCQTLPAGNHVESLCFSEKQGKRSISLLTGVDWRDRLEYTVARWQKKSGVTGKIAKAEEIALAEFVAQATNLLEQSKTQPEIQAILSHGLPAFCEPMISNIFSIYTLEMPASKRELKAYCKRRMLPALGEELIRIFSKKAEKEFCGHPVHYVMEDDGTSEIDEDLDVLLTALRLNGRLLSGQVMKLDAYSCTMPRTVVESAYRLQRGSAVIITLRELTDVECDFDDSWKEGIKAAAEMSQKYANSVLTVIVAPSRLRVELHSMEERCAGMTFVRLMAEPSGRTAAAPYVRELLKDAGLSDDMEVLEELDLPRDYCTRAEIKQSFACWHDRYMRVKRYPAYGKMQKTSYSALQMRETAENEETDPLEELQSLIGLTEAKRLVRNAIDFCRMQRLCAERGIQTPQPSMHMVFTGHAGTAKTTVARLVGRICKKYGILPVGDLIEVGRKDLVGAYVGWTAKAVGEVFERAKGSVLFVDEAYSLLDEQMGSFGDEAINAIVQHMENARKDTIVILAGYSERMQALLERNAGLRSRISFHIDFPDYTEEELLAIFRRDLQEFGRKIDRGGEKAVRQQLRAAMKNIDFGNGRYVRTIVERAVMAQASRLLSERDGEISNADIRLLCEEDFTAVMQRGKDDPKVRIGFAG